MSSSFVFNELKRFFPQAVVVDLSGNNFALFMEFPTVDGRQASVCIYEDGVAVYCKDGEYITKEQYAQLQEKYFEDGDDSFHQYETIIFSSDGNFSDGSQFFDNNVMIDIGKTWDKFNRCYSIAMGE
jgi:hypothetical protein